MVRVMIADDEAYEREYLKRFIAEHYADIMQVVYEAKDGQEVLEKAEELHPDIILLDIRMPRLSGLEAAQEIRRRLPRTELIILSAYGEFSYARQAIKLGVRDFLVKPYLDGELSGTLDKLLSSMNLSGKEQDGPQDTKEVLYEDVDRDIVWDLAFARLSEQGLKRGLRMWGITGGTYKCLVFYHTSIRRLGTAGCEVIRGFFRLEDAQVAVNYLFGQMILYVFSDDELVYTEMNACIRRTRAYLRELEDSTVFCGVSGIYTSLADSGKAYEEAAAYITEYSGEEMRDRFREVISDTRETVSLENKLCFSVANRNDGQSRELGQGLARIVTRRYADTGRETQKNQLRRITMLIARRLNAQSGSRIRTEDALKIHRLFSENGEYAGRSPEECVETAVSVMLAAYKVTPLNNNGQLVRRAKEYMKLHYGEAIGLQSVADGLGVSAGYLSKCFKNLEEVSFTEYLTNIRLEEAKRLMRDTEETVAEIAYRVGFSDPNYFGKCFKKNEQISPKEYLAMQRQDSGES